MRRRPVDPTNRSPAAFRKLQHILIKSLRLLVARIRRLEFMSVVTFRPERHRGL